ncbi:MAG: flavodoxin domain-containing protein [Candidatus Bathyarchaeia archaeon]
MAKVLIVFESRYGNTKHVAESITEGIRENDGIDVSLREVKDVDLNEISLFDAILIGSPNHVGGPTRGIRGFIDRLGGLRLEGRRYAVFDTFMGGDFKKAVKKMEKHISEKAPDLKRVVAGLSIKVKGIKGPILEDELPKCKEFGKNIAIQLKREHEKG